MKTVLVQINNSKAYKLLEDLEDLDLIKVLSKDLRLTKEIGDKKKPSDYFGTLSEEAGEKMQQYVRESRSQWERSI